MKKMTAAMILPILILVLLSGCGGGGTDESANTGGAFGTKRVTTLAGAYTYVGDTDGVGAAARFRWPFGITAAGTNLYVADSLNSTIRKIATSSRLVSTVAGSAGMEGSVDATGTDAQFNRPLGITSDGTSLFVADTNNHVIRQVLISSGTVSTLAGTALLTGTTDSIGAAARFYSPRGITTDGTNLYVTDNVNDTIRKIVIATGEVSTLAGSTISSGSTDGTGTAALFLAPAGITTVGGNLYVTDKGNNTIRKIVISSGLVTTLTGSAGLTGSADGTGSAALFKGPEGIATDGVSLFVADQGNHTIRKIVIATGVVTTVAGSAGSPGYADGSGTAARFNAPSGITRIGSILYVADTNNDVIRMLY